MELLNQTGISLKNSLAASLLAQMFLPPSSSLSPFTVPSVCHLLSRFSDLFMKYVCTTPFAMAAEECWNCDQAYFLFPFVQFVSSSPLDLVGVSGLVLNSCCGFKPGPCRAFSGCGKAGHGSSVKLGGWDLSESWQEVESGLGCSSCLSEFNSHKEELYFRGFGQ